jgi:hypothetical protein
LQSTCKPNSVRLRSRPHGRELRRDDHSSSPGIADGIEQPTRRPQAGRLLPHLRTRRLPIWSCSVRGFACHDCYQPRGALLPHLFTLTHRRSPPCGLELWWAVYFLCHCPSGRPARELPGALPCGVRTFLSRAHFASPALRRATAGGYTRQRSSGRLQQTSIAWSRVACSARTQAGPNAASRHIRFVNCTAQSRFLAGHDSRADATRASGKGREPGCSTMQICANTREHGPRRAAPPLPRALATSVNAARANALRLPSK